MQKLILASGSPRRKVLMQCMGLIFDVVPSTFNEWLDDSRTPEEMATELGIGKANEVASKFPNAFVVGGDLIVVVDGKQLAKPESKEEAVAMLQLLNNRTHQAVGSVVLVNKSKHIQDSNVAVVDITFTKIPSEVIEAYIATGDPYDKAGGYARQHPLLAPYITIHGDAHAVTGMSTIQLRELLEKHGIKVPNDEAKTSQLFKNTKLVDQRILH